MQKREQNYSVAVSGYYPTMLPRLAQPKQGNSVWSWPVRLSQSPLTQRQAAGSDRLFTAGSFGFLLVCWVFFVGWFVGFFKMLMWYKLQKQVLPATQIPWTVMVIRGHPQLCLLGYRSSKSCMQLRDSETPQFLVLAQYLQCQAMQFSIRLLLKVA